MSNKIKIIVLSLLTIQLASSCCKNTDYFYRFPEEAIRYYDDHDTIKFYSEELHTWEEYIVCLRDTTASSACEVLCTFGNCQNTSHFVSKKYMLKMYSCSDERYFSIEIKSVPPAKGSSEQRTQIDIMSKYSTDYWQTFWRMYGHDLEPEVEVLGKVYENVAKWDNLSYENRDTLQSMIFSLEYGIIQYQYKHATFGLVNEEE